MTLLFSGRAEHQLASLSAGDWPDNEFDRVVSVLIWLERDASGFEAAEFPVAVDEEPLPDVGPLKAIIIEANPGFVFVVLYRLALDAEDVWIEDIGYGR